MFIRKKVEPNDFEMIKSKLARSEGLGRELLSGKRIRHAPVYFTVSDSLEDCLFAIAPVEIKSDQGYYCMLIGNIVIELCLESIFENELKVVSSTDSITPEIELKIKKAICTELGIKGFSQDTFRLVQESVE